MASPPPPGLGGPANRPIQRARPGRRPNTARQYVVVSGAPGHQLMACKARGCSWSRAYHASRIDEHLLDCQLAKSELPTILRDLGRAPNGDPLVPGATPEWLPGVQLAFVVAMLRSALPFGTFDSPLWRTVFTRVSHGLFTGPGTRQAVSGWVIDKVTDKYC